MTGPACSSNSPSQRPGSYLARSHPSDVARVEDRTFICTTPEMPDTITAGPIRNQCGANKRIIPRHRGRTLCDSLFYGPLDAPLAKIGVEIADSPVVCNMRIMTRMGLPVLKKLGETGGFIPCLHSWAPLTGPGGCPVCEPTK